MPAVELLIGHGSAAKHDDADGCAKSRALRYTERGNGGKAVVEHALHYGAGGRENRAYKNCRRCPRKPNAHNGGSMSGLSCTCEYTQNIAGRKLHAADTEIENKGAKCENKQYCQKETLSGNMLLYNPAYRA